MYFIGLFLNSLLVSVKARTHDTISCIQILLNSLILKLSLWFQHKATITRCDLSPRFFCVDATLLCEFESDKI